MYVTSHWNALHKCDVQLSPCMLWAMPLLVPIATRLTKSTVILCYRIDLNRLTWHALQLLSLIESCAVPACGVGTACLWTQLTWISGYPDYRGYPILCQLKVLKLYPIQRMRMTRAKRRLRRRNPRRKAWWRAACHGAACHQKEHENSRKTFTTCVYLSRCLYTKKIV